MSTQILVRWKCGLRTKTSCPRPSPSWKVFARTQSDAKYTAALAEAKAIKKAQAKKTKALQKKIVHVGRGGLNKKPHLTMLLIALCGIVGLLTNFGISPTKVVDLNGDGQFTRAEERATTSAFKTQPLYRWLQFTSVGPPEGEKLSAEYLETGNIDDLRLRTASLMRGEVWRLVTPSFYPLRLHAHLFQSVHAV